MDLEVLKERETPLLSRRRVTLMAAYGGATPSRKDLTKDIAKKLNVNEKLVILKHIYTRFGLQKAKIIAHVYGNEEDMKTYEDISLLKKHSKIQLTEEEKKKAEEKEKKQEEIKEKSEKKEEEKAE